MNKIKKEIKKVTFGISVEAKSIDGEIKGAEIMIPSQEEQHERIFRIYFPLDMRRWYYKQYTEIISLRAVNKQWNWLKGTQAARCYEEDSNCDCEECNYYKKYTLSETKCKGKGEGVLSLVIEPVEETFRCNHNGPLMWTATYLFQQKTSEKFFTVFQFKTEDRPSIEEFLEHDSCEFFVES